MSHTDCPHVAPVALVLHDVAPATRARCAQLLQALAPLIRPHGPVPVTHLVVPRYHNGQSPAGDRAFRHWLDERLAHGDEVVLHGYRHQDCRPLRGPFDALRRRVYTTEGEFSLFDADQARWQLQAGLDLLADCGWHPRGFVAPAWLMSDAVRQVLPEMGFGWTASRTGLIDLITARTFPTTSLVWSVRAAWRRGLSELYNRRLLDRLLVPSAATTPIRLGLHPVDADWPRVVAFWRQALAAALIQRPAGTKSELVHACRHIADAHGAYLRDS